MQQPELWVGVEPTVNRVENTFLDQLSLSGFEARLDDLDRLASLGAAAVRFPLLWERTAPQGLAGADWRWGDTRLARLQELGLRPILGLVHHGSGPRHTSLLDPGFAEELAAYARAVARRYPHVTAYTPVNEPLTTARFSALYGHWYPHARDEASFWQALLHQLRGTVLAMQAIREVNPAAQLMQTEDLGRVFGTPLLQPQAEFENERRWLSFDLLLGRVDERHPMWSYLRWAGAQEREVLWFAEHPCPPDVLGLNTYVTSERFLDERLGRYPPHTHGSNGRLRYADVEAVRVRGDELGGPAARLREAHARYDRPLALTEVHLGCTREEQLRWLQEAWQGAAQVRREGADVRAVTVWAALGAYEWNSLLTRRDGHYEPGAWDVRAPVPRPTALAGLARDLAAGRAPPHPVLAGPGWWRRAERLLYPPAGPVRAEPVAGPPLLILGTGTPAQAFAHACELRGLPHRLQPAEGLGDLGAALRAHRPWAVADLSGLQARAPGSPQESGGARARTCAELGVRLLAFTPAPVVSGQAETPPTESGVPDSLGAAWPGALVVRSGLLFGTGDAHDPATRVRGELQAGRQVRAATDEVGSPTFLPDLIHAALDLLIDGEAGLWHLVNGEPLSRAEFARRVAAACGLDPARVDAVPAARPTSQALASERGWPLPPLEDALRRWHTHVDKAVSTPDALPAD